MSRQVVLLTDQVERMSQLRYSSCSTVSWEQRPGKTMHFPVFACATADLLPCAAIQPSFLHVFMT